MKTARARAAAARSRRRLVVNGRFLTQPVTGVQRYGRELVGALDRLLAGRAADGDAWAAEILSPPGAPPLEGLAHLTQRQVGRFGGQGWEQTVLPLAAGRGSLLLSLCNTAPLGHPRQVVCIHDAAVHAVPESYGLAFRTWYRLLHGHLGRQAARVLTVSAFSAGELGRHVGVTGDRIAVVPNAADHFARLVPDPAILARHGLKPGSYVFALGSRARAKNLGAAAAAMGRIAGLRPLLVTAGHRNGRIFAGVGDLPGEGVRELGPVTDAELKALYAGALCLVFPSLYEGFGLPPLEAMIAGCPVVAARATSLPEVCGDAALYVDPRDPDDIAAAIVTLRDDPALRADLVRRGSRRAAAFGWDRSAARLFEVLDGLA